MPDNPTERCHYLANWTAVKLQWDLTVDPAEQNTLTFGAAECPGTDVTINPVP